MVIDISYSAVFIYSQACSQQDSGYKTFQHTWAQTRTSTTDTNRKAKMKLSTVYTLSAIFLGVMGMPRGSPHHFENHNLASSRRSGGPVAWYDNIRNVTCSGDKGSGKILCVKGVEDFLLVSVDPTGRQHGCLLFSQN